MKPAILVITLVALAWIANGEMKAQAIDDAFGVSATECTYADPTFEQSIRIVGLTNSASGHEMLYIKLRNKLIKRCASSATASGAASRP